MSHSYTVNLVESLGGDFHVTVREWKQVAENKDDYEAGNKHCILPLGPDSCE